VALPLILAGPILRRVEPNLVAVWVALHEPAGLRLSIWENQVQAADADEASAWFRSPNPVDTLRVADGLHLAVVTLRLPEGKTLVPERLYSYDLEIARSGGNAERLESLGLLAHDPPNADPDGEHVKHLALGYEPGLLPCLALPPKALTDLRLVHGSCRNVDTSFPDGLAWLDDLLTRDDAYKSALKRPHQLFLTGDQIYADEVARPLLHMLNGTAQTLIGTGIEQLPFRDRSQPPAVLTAAATLANFPVGVRKPLIVNEASMTTNAGGSHLMSFGEFCAMYLYVWSNVCWEDQLTQPPEQTALPPEGAVSQIEPAVLRALFTTNAAGETVAPPAYTAERYEEDLANLREFHRTLPKVRRALANVATYMVFDDHEITDDWFLNPTWRDRVLSSPLGSAVIRNGLLAYALFQDWGNDPVRYEPRPGISEKQPHEELLAAAARFFPAGAGTAPDSSLSGPAHAIEDLLGLQQRNQVAADGSYAETDPKLKWFYTVPGTRHQVLVLDCRTRRAFASRISPPGNIGKTAQKEQIPDLPSPAGKDVWFVVASLPVIGPPIFDELFAPALFRIFDAKDGEKLQLNRGTRLVPGTNPDAVEGWCFDPVLFEHLLARLKPYGPVVVLSGDVHYSAANAMSYWTRGSSEPARVVQFISSGFKNVMPSVIVMVDRSFAVAQRMIRSDIGAERLGWASHEPSPVQVPSGSKISPRLRGMLRKSPLLLPTIGWRGATSSEPDWSWRVTPIRDTRADADRPVMARPATLFPDDPDKTGNDLAATTLDGYHRTVERHAREMDRLNNCRQVLFGSALGLVTFAARTEKDGNGQDVGVTYAVQDLYTIKRNPEDLVAPPSPEVFTRHEVALRDLRGTPPRLRS
jgi:hypothetical protein